MRHRGKNQVNIIEIKKTRLNDIKSELSYMEETK